MPPKRAITIHSDDEGSAPESSPASKRARTQEDSDTGLASRPKRATKGKGKSRQRTEEAVDLVDEEEDAVEQTAPDEDEEKRFEEEHEEEIRENLMSKGKAQGGIAEMGIIESIEMHQFMCHKYLTFQFGPQINFIIGHNGSGKSAVLSALTVALGGKANSTGRGSGLKSFIREGQSVAEVTVCLKNQGEEAYKPKDYGKTIVITRRFTREGSSSYKIKSKEGKVVSTKREELSAICDHMNIQVDNPMNILTQDAARQFLSASQPADKYKFFLRGTQLSQLSEEYQTCLENISQTQKVLKRKSEVIPDLQDALEEATARFREANKAREQRHKADELKKELAWAHVQTKQDELQEKLEEAAKLSRRLPKIREQIAAANKEFEESSQLVQAYEEENHNLGSIGHLHEMRNEINSKLKTNKQKLATMNNEEKEMLRGLKRVNDAIANLDARIQEEVKKDEDASKERRDDLNRRLEEAKVSCDQAERQLQDLKDERQQRGPETEKIKQDIQKLNQEREQLKRSIVECQEQVRMCVERERNKVARFGTNMDRVMADIQRTRWHGNKPVGPFGLFVGVKDPAQWAPIIRVQLGALMSGFAVTDARDRKTLEKLLKGHGNRNPSIVISEVDLFDYSRGEPPEGYLTVLRALEISDEYILRVLINQAHVEGTFLAPTRSDADSVLLQYGRGGTAWSGDLYNVRRFPEGGGQSSVIHALSMGDPRQQLFTGNDATADKQRWQERGMKLEQQYNLLSQQIDQLKQTETQKDREARSLAKQESDMLRRSRGLKDQRDSLQIQVNNDMPVGISGLQDSRADMVKEKEAYESQWQTLDKERKEVNEAQRPLLEEANVIKKQIEEFSELQVGIQNKISVEAVRRLNAQNTATHFSEKLQAEEAKVTTAEDVVKTLQTEFEQWTAKATEYCERFENPRKAEDVQKNLEAVQTALREREKKQGATVEDMTIEVNKKKAALETAKKDLKNMLSLNRALRRSVKVRLAKWHEFRRHIALRCKVYFSYHLSNRGYYGKVLFDHVNGSLQLKVQTDDQTSTQNSREKDPRSLSGGEKSFSTICLLLSLWESIGCPIRCLDEFDVFMDAVNRRISMRMMIDTANSSNNKQYVLITPQDMTNIHVSPSVRVHRMTDPERGQGVLAFQ
ncbi:Structural maintenance of chromosomes protein [Sparassis crispa]|uniref:Structural maintenance of chromosomes protein n=1 Tax=Sparassis crispa TaxID=139825 RepID=A0A401GM08_9APHY|nr:Structural maintenance of chromosomes protein [Sparassis crispa]GBE83226.1 Structural maintenance of chromosomes protein [Sparassis crispa]